MGFNEVTDKYKQEAYDLIKSIYKFIPYYNQIKGTYLGVQFILNTMGLCVTITELWAEKDSIKNFSENDIYYREDEINAVRNFIQVVAEDGKTITKREPAQIDNLYLTSKFDIDMNQKSGITLIEFNGMAETINDVVMQIRPVTRCLRKLYYFLTINTDLHFCYNYNGDTIELNDESSAEDKYGLKIRTFHYIWDVSNKSGNTNISYNPSTKQLDFIRLPYISMAAKYNDSSEPEYTNDLPNTFKNTYFNLCNLGYKMKASSRKSFRFKLYIRKKSEYNYEDPSLYPDFDTYPLLIDSNNGRTFEQDNSAIIIKFNGYIKNVLSEYLGNTDVYDYDIYLATTFSIVLGTDYIFQKSSEDEPINWNMNNLSDGYPGFIFENSSKYNPVFIEFEDTDENGPTILYENG